MPEPMDPLLRLRQLALEINNAIACNDIEIVSQAAALIAPTLARLQGEGDGSDPVSGSLTPSLAAEIALETQQLLLNCEMALLRQMRQVTMEMRRLQQGKCALDVRRRPASQLGSRLDTRR